MSSQKQLESSLPPLLHYLIDGGALVYELCEVYEENSMKQFFNNTRIGLFQRRVGPTAVGPAEPTQHTNGVYGIYTALFVCRVTLALSNLIISQRYTSFTLPTSSFCTCIGHVIRGLFLRSLLYQSTCFSSKNLFIP